MTKQSLIPCLRYENAPAAIEFLCGAFGFERHAVFADDEDPTLTYGRAWPPAAGDNPMRLYWPELASAI